MFAHATSDYHPDHRVAGEIALDARILCSVPLIEGAFAPCFIPHVFTMDTLDGSDFAPEHVVDITDVIEHKSAVLGEHASQREWLNTAYGMDYQESMREHGRARGDLVGVRYGEAFRSINTFPQVGGPDLLPNVRAVA
ncbi:hypothetical protein N599_31545 [Saccharopolyspora erythraea D]|nr:hypothetical protein N599_31545 [Saccharopolyspora erythraea D]